MTLRTRLVRIGNSRGLRLPKLLLAEARLSDEVEVRVEQGRLVVQAARRPRQGWAAQGAQMHARDEDRLLDPPTATRFDEDEWTWER